MLDENDRRRARVTVHERRDTEEFNGTDSIRRGR